MSGRPVVYGRISASHPRNTASVEQQHSALLEYVRSRWPEEYLIERMSRVSVGPLDLAAERFRAAHVPLETGFAGRRARTSRDTRRHP